MRNYNIGKLLDDYSVTKILQALGHKEEPKIHKNGLIFSTSVCHQGNHFKLFWYSKTCSFRCWSECHRNFDIIDLVKRNLNCPAYSAVDFICSILGWDSENSMSDLEIEIIKAERAEKKENINWEIKRNPPLAEYLLNTLPQIPYQGWIEEGITEETQRDFDVRYFAGERRIVVPHYQWDTGECIGAMGRAISKQSKCKWLPIFNFNKTWNIYALNKCIDIIKEKKEIILAESEKSPMKARQMGLNNVCAISGCSLSETQNGILYYLSSQIDGLQIVIAYDKDIEFQNIKRNLTRLSWYVEKIYILPSFGCPKLGGKDSPFDKTPEVFWELYNARKLII